MYIIIYVADIAIFYKNVWLEQKRTCDIRAVSWKAKNYSDNRIDVKHLNRRGHKSENQIWLHKTVHKRRSLCFEAFTYAQNGKHTNYLRIRLLLRLFANLQQLKTLNVIDVDILVHKFLHLHLSDARWTWERWLTHLEADMENAINCSIGKGTN